jgi:hypothetical protein
MTTTTAWRPGDPLYDRGMNTGCPRSAFEVLNVHLDGDCATCGDLNGLHYIDGWRWSPTEPVTGEWSDLCSPAGPGTDFYGAVIGGRAP